MTPLLKNKCLEILKKCDTLEVADKMLMTIFELKNPEKSPIRWGLFDGWAGRPRTLAGLPGVHDTEAEAIADYNEACEIGRELSMREMPG